MPHIPQGTTDTVALELFDPALDAALRRVRPGTYRIRVIHGHHGGTALRELVRREYGRHPQVLRLEAAGPGGTELVLREF